MLVVSHDCDLAAAESNDPTCEIVVGNIIESLDGNYTNGKSPRKLHLTISAGENHVAAEFLSSAKRTISKSNLFSINPAKDVRLTRSEHSDLVKWLVARYRRESFPEEFNNRFKRAVLKKFVKIVKRTECHLQAVLFDVDEGRDIERQDPDDTYSLTVHLVYRVSDDPTAAETEAAKATNDIRDAISKAFFVDGKWTNIELVECSSFSEDAYSVYFARVMREWRFDYLSLDVDPG